MHSERCAEPCAQQDRLLFGAQDEHGCSFLAHVEIFLVSEVLGALTPDQVLDTKFFTRSPGSTTACAFVILQCAHGSVQCGIRMVLYYENMYRREQQNLPEANFLFAAIGYVEFRLDHVRFRF